LDREPLRTPLPFLAGIAIFGLFVMALGGLAAPQARAQADEGLIDYPGFLQLGGEIAAYRESRLIDLDDFNAMKDDPGTIIIDARSAGNYVMGHIDGAVNLNFSDFSDGMLAEVIGAKDRRILIYCNNNFTDNVAPVMLKRVELALNVPTFINLYGYGYENIYELSGAYSIHDPAISWVAHASLQEN
jgi:phage shock protein E